MGVVLLALGAGCITPAYAITTTYTVNTLAAGQADSNVGDGICQTSTNECSLRAALEEANAAIGLPGDDIRIQFEASLTGDIEHNGGTPRMYNQTLGSTVINDYLGVGAFLHVDSQRPVTIDFGNRVGAVQKDDAGYAMFYIESNDVVIENFQNAEKREADGTGGYGDVAGIEGAEAAIVIGGSRVTLRNGISSDPGTIAMETCVALIDGAADVRIEDYYCRSSVLFGVYVDERAEVSRIALNRAEFQGGQGYGDIWIEFGAVDDETIVHGLSVTDTEFRSLRGEGIDYTIGIREDSLVENLVISNSRFLGADTWGIGLFPRAVTTGMRVENSTIDGAAYFIVDRAGVAQNGLVIRDNLFNSVFGDILQLTSSPFNGAIIEGNQFLQGRQQGNVAPVRLGPANFGLNNVIRNNVFDQQESEETNRFAIWVESNPGVGENTGWSIVNNTVRNIFGSAYGPISLFNNGNTLVVGNTFGEGTRGADAEDTNPEFDDSFFVANNSGGTNGRIQTWRPTAASFSGAAITVRVAPVDPPIGGNTAPTNPVLIDVYLTATDKAETYLGRIPGFHSSQTTFVFTSTATGGFVRTQVTDALGRSSQYSSSVVMAEGLDGTGDADQDGLPDGAECPLELLGLALPLLCPDSDGDGMRDFQDPDDDNDGIPTRTECPNGSPCVNTDSDGLLPNHLDTDSDNDGILDSIECASGTDCVDTDGDGAADYVDTDSDGDGIADIVECPLAICRDTDGDGTPNYRDTDDDGDGASSENECPNGIPCPDYNNDGVPNYLDASYIAGTLEARGTGGGAFGPWALMLLGGLALLRRRSLLPMAGLMSLLAAFNTQAAEVDWTSRFYGGAMAGALFTDFDKGGLTRALQNDGYAVDEISSDGEDLAYGAWLGYAVNSYLGAELVYTTGADERVKFSGNVGGDLRGALDTASPYLKGFGDTYLARLRYHYAINDRWFLSPHIGAGITQTRQSFKTGSETVRYSEDSFTWAVGGGLHYALSPDWSVGVGGDYYQSSGKNAYGVLSGIVEWRFPRALPIREYQVPAAEPEPVQVVPLASIAPAPELVQVASTESVPAPESIALDGVGFEVNSDRLTAESRGILDKAAATVQDRLAQDPQLQVEVSGHTDSTGKEARNVALSQARAGTVLEYLAGKGIPRERLTAVGYGASQPVASNDTAEGRSRNRRVELKISNL